MPARCHPAAEFPLPLLASLAAPSPTSGGGDWPPPSLGRSSLPSLPPQAGVGLPCNTMRTVQPVRTILITLRYHARKTAHPPPTPRPIRPAPLPTLGGQDYPTRKTAHPDRKSVV